MTQTINALRTETRPVETRLDEELTLRVEAAGYGGVPLKAKVPGVTLTSIEESNFPVQTTLKIRVPGYGWRTVGATISDDVTPNKARTVRLSVPGYGNAPLRMAFAGR